MHTVQLKAKKFEQEHLELSLKYFNSKVWPQYFDNVTLNEKFKGMKYVRRIIIPIKDIVRIADEETLNKFIDSSDSTIMHDYSRSLLEHVQAVRANGRGEFYQQIWESIQKHGYQLCHKPGSVCRLPDGRIWIMDSRTRLEFLIEQGFTDIIVDLYECDNYASFTKFALFSNPPESPRSPQTISDVVFVGSSLVERGDLKTSDIEDFVDTVTGSSVDTYSRGKMIQRIKAKDSTTSITRTSANCYKWLRDHGYHDNINNNGIYYLVISASSAASAITTAANELEKLKAAGHKVKQLRLVVNPGPLDSKDVVKSWYDRAGSFHKTFNNNITVISDQYYKSKATDGVIVLYGIIPTVSSLAQKYPMGRIVVYEDELKSDTISFEDIQINDNLSKLLEMNP